MKRDSKTEANEGNKAPLKSLCFLCLLLFAFPNPVLAQTWVQTSAPITNWVSVASSADGSKIVAAAGDPLGLIYTSADSGASWMPTSAPGSAWSSVASSADGRKLVAAGYGLIVTSTNAGATWTTNSLPALGGSFVACSADGTKLALAARVSSEIYTSTDAGATWTPSRASTFLQAIACSADGTKLVAAESGCFFAIPGDIVTSINSGATWNVSTNAPNLQCAVFVACSADGSRMSAGGGDHIGPICTSTDWGANWGQTSAPITVWSSAAESADGTKLVAVADGPGFGPDHPGGIYSSSDSGKIWIQNDAPATNWTSVASSADGSALIAVVSGGGIYTFHAIPIPALTVTASGANLLISWIVPSIEFRLQQNSDLSAATWVDVTNTPTLNSTHLQYEVALPAPFGQRFYRLGH